MFVDRYAEVGLRMNPFAGELLDETYGALFVDRGLPEPPGPGSAVLVQLIGDKGAGKTTQLLAWREQRPAPYHYVPSAPYRERWATPPVAPLVYADEIDRMPALLRRSWFRRLNRAPATVVAGTHVDLTSTAARAGLRVVTHHLGIPTATFLDQVFRRRFEYVEIAGSDRARLDVQQLAAIHRRSGGSIRAAEVLAHELVADQASRLSASDPSNES